MFAFIFIVDRLGTCFCPCIHVGGDRKAEDILFRSSVFILVIGGEPIFFCLHIALFWLTAYKAIQNSENWLWTLMKKKNNNLTTRWKLDDLFKPSSRIFNIWLFI